MDSPRPEPEEIGIDTGAEGTTSDLAQGAGVEKRIGQYKTIREIGHGGMGVVYLAVRADDQYRKQVAIKVIRVGEDSEEILRRFLQERQILASLDHPNIARLIDGGTTEDGLPYFVMDYVDGEHLDLYSDSRCLTVDERLRLFQPICSAVSYAHRNLVVHRDIKPSNIIVTGDGVPKLGGEHPEIALNLADLAGVLAANGSYAEAETLARESVGMNRKLLGEGHPDFAQSLHRLADVLVRQKRYAEAETLAHEAIVIADKMLPHEHPDISVYNGILGAALAGLGRFKEAERSLLGSYASLNSLPGRESETHALLVDIVRMYEASGQRKEAEKYRLLLDSDRS